MQSKPHLIEPAAELAIGSKAPQVKSAQAPLKDIVREALLSVLADAGASAAAKASAGRTLMQYFDEQDQGLTPRGAEMSAAELDSAIARLKR